MYNIMIVDDDALFVTMFINNFPWEEYDFHIACHAETGVRAIQLLQQNTIDLAFIDMCMPGMNGPELILYIHQHFPQTVCVALSNHDDFDFVKESFRAGAMDYVLKHCLNQQEMQRIISAFSEYIKRDARQLPQGAKAKTDFMSVSLYLTALLEGHLLQEVEDYSLADSLHVPQLRRNLLVFRTDIVDFKKFQKKYFEASRLKYILRTICSILGNVLEHHTKGVVFYSDSDECFYSILTDERFGDLQFLNYTRELYIRQINSTLRMYLNVESDSIAAPLVADIRDIRRAYLALRRETSSEQSAFVASTRLIDTERLYARAMKALRFTLKSPEMDDLRRYIASLYESGHQQQYSQSQFRQLSIVLYKCYLALEKEAGIVSTDASEAEFSTLVSSKKHAEMEECITALFADLYNRSRNTDEASYSVHVQAALEIIRRQYGMSTLSLNTISKMVHVSDSYLSRSFKQELGLGLSEYINRFRIERAQSLLLLAQVSVKAVSARCGFEDYNYFFRIFKKYVGLTPKEFCKKNLLDVE